MKIRIVRDPSEAARFVLVGLLVLLWALLLVRFTRPIAAPPAPPPAVATSPVEHTINHRAYAHCRSLHPDWPRSRCH